METHVFSLSAVSVMLNQLAILLHRHTLVVHLNPGALKSSIPRFLPRIKASGPPFWIRYLTQGLQKLDF